MDCTAFDPVCPLRLGSRLEKGCTARHRQTALSVNAATTSKVMQPTKEFLESLRMSRVTALTAASVKGVGLADSVRCSLGTTRACRGRGRHASTSRLSIRHDFMHCTLGP